MTAGVLGTSVTRVLDDLNLDPATASWRRQRSGAQEDWLVLPSADRPQLLVPFVPAAADLVGHRLAVGAGARARRRLAVAVVRSGAATHLPLRRLQISDARLADLREWLAPGRSDTRLGVLLGPARANRKAVLVLLDQLGSPLCYAKVGRTTVSRRLVRGEAAALGKVAALDLRLLQAPGVLRHGTWNGLDLLATTPLAGPTTQRHPTALPVAATRELLGRGVRTDVPLGACGALAVPGGRDVPSRSLVRLAAAHSRLLIAAGDRRVPLGAAHGDWTPWNMAVREDGVLEGWDWERFDPAAPQGLDVVHFALAAVGPDDPPARTAAVLAQLPAQLFACGVDARLVHILLCTYLVHVGHRYAHDLAGQPAPSVERRLRWVLHLLEEQLPLLDPEETR